MLRESVAHQRIDVRAILGCHETGIYSGYNTFAGRLVPTQIQIITKHDWSNSVPED